MSTLASVAILAALVASAPSGARCDPRTSPFGFQSGLPGGLIDVDGDGNGVEFDRAEAEAFNDDSYASAMSIIRGIAYVTGSTYGAYFDRGGDQDVDVVHLEESDCFLAAIEVPGRGDGDQGVDGTAAGGGAMPRVLNSFRVGSASTPEACASLAAFDRDLGSGAETEKTKLVLLGRAEEGGTLTGLRENGSTKAVSYGYALDVELDVGGERAVTPPGEEVAGGRLLHSSRVQYPAAIAAEAGDADGSGAARYVAVLSTDDNGDGGAGPASAAYRSSSPPDRRDTARARPYGRTFDATVLKLVPKSEAEIEADAEQANIVGGPDYEYRETSRVLWEQTFAPAEGALTDDRRGVDVASLLYVPREDGDDFLLLAGTTSGYGSAFGSDGPDSDGGGGDLDGFVTKLRTDTGEELWPPPPTQGEEALARADPHSVRISSQPGRDDVVRSVCLEPTRTNTNTDGATAAAALPRYAYIAGSTAGVMDPSSLPTAAASAGGNDSVPDQAFLLKLNLDDMTIEWRRQFGSPGVEAVVPGGCAGSADGTAVYLAGTARDGGSILSKGGMPERTTSAGGDDVFVIKLDAGTGEVRWMRQVGTSADDWLAEGGGGVAAAGDGDGDGDGGVVLYGSTRGSLMRWRGDDKGAGADGKPMAADVFLVAVTSEGDFRAPSEQQRGPHSAGGGDSSGSSSSSPGSQDDGDTVGLSSTASPPPSDRPSFSLLLVGCITTLSAAALLLGHRYASGAGSPFSSGGQHGREEVEIYLRDFEDTEIDIRASATGGWHGMYSFDAATAPVKGGRRSAAGGYSDEVTLDAVSTSSGDSNSSDAGAGSREHHKDGFYSTAGGRSSIALSSSSVVKDAFFFDDDINDANGGTRHQTPSIGFGAVHDDNFRDEVDENEGEREGYAGLVDSYNATWEQRNPHSMGGGDGGGEGQGSSLGLGSPGRGSIGDTGRGLLGSHAEDFDDDENDPGRLKEIL